MANKKNNNRRKMPFENIHLNQKQWNLFFYGTLATGIVGFVTMTVGLWAEIMWPTYVGAVLGGFALITMVVTMYVERSREMENDD
ncbi:MAG: hypothetical protein GX061_07525 [Eubacteriaceae bacterium]|nr:hypothetical protein [Eubacteriaceae bacterium]